MRRKRSLQLWLDVETHQRIHELSERSRVPMNTILRDVLPGALDVWARARGLDTPTEEPAAPPPNTAHSRRWVDEHEDDED